MLNLPSSAAPPEFSNVLHSHPRLWHWRFFPLWGTGWKVHWEVHSPGVWNPEELSLAQGERRRGPQFQGQRGRHCNLWVLRILPSEYEAQ
uniref:Uncharacterized protein n=1 Tax=Xenopus tropicalis TaxID=8364 RepID=A0A1B8Y393_XENTR